MNMRFNPRKFRISLVLFIILACFVAYYLFRFLSIPGKNKVKYINVNNCSESSKRVIESKNCSKTKLYQAKA